jgi:hypothetical protein
VSEDSWGSLGGFLVFPGPDFSALVLNLRTSPCLRSPSACGLGHTIPNLSWQSGMNAVVAWAAAAFMLSELKILCVKSLEIVGMRIE